MADPPGNPSNEPLKAQADGTATSGAAPKPMSSAVPRPAGPPRPKPSIPPAAPPKPSEAIVTADLAPDELEEDLGATGNHDAVDDDDWSTAATATPAKGPPPRTRPPPAPPRTSPAPKVAPPNVRTPAPIAALGAQRTPKPAPPAPMVPAPKAPTVPAPRAPMVIEASVSDLAPSESMAATAERPLATQPGAASLAVQRARATATALAAHVASLRATKRTSDAPRLARLLVEAGLAAERVGDLSRATEHFVEALDLDAALLPAARGARRVMRDAPLEKRLALIDREAALVTSEADRADLLVERARTLEADEDLGRTRGRGHSAAIVRAYREALALKPAHADALKGLEAALVRARAAARPDEAAALDAQLAEHYGRMAAAYGGDPELAATYLAARARVLEAQNDLVVAEEAWAASLAADGRVGPTREAYKRLLARRKAWAKLRDAIAEEAGREHDMARSVRLLHEAARISVERLSDEAQAIGLLEHAASRAPTDPAVDAQVLDELARLLERRGDAKGAAVARRALLEHEAEPAARASFLRRLGDDFDAIGEQDAAIHAFAHALALEPLHLRTQLALDRLLAARGRHEERVRLWLDEAAKAREPARRAAAYVRAAHVAEDALGRPDEALEHLRAAWVTDTGNVDALDELTRLLLPPSEVRHGVGGGEGRSARALIDLFGQAAQTAREPARKIAYLEKIAALWEDALGNPAEAARVYEKVLAIEPTRRFALLALQRACERSGEFRGLAAAIETEADQASDARHAAALRLRAAEVWRARAGDPERGVALARRVLRDHPGDDGALRALLAAQESAGRWEEVEKTLVEAIRGAKGEAAVALWLELAEVRRRRLGRLDGAIAAWRSALSIAPSHALAVRELSRALRARGEWKQVAELEERIASTATDPAAVAGAWVRAAEVYEGRLDDDARAQAAYASALAARPEDLAAWDGLARLAERRGAHDDLATAYRLRIEREEADGAPRMPLRIALAELLARRGDDPRAIAVALDRVLVESPGHLASQHLLETLHRRTGNDVALAKALTGFAQVTRDPLAKRGILWDLVRLQERTDEGVAASPPIAAHLLVYELDPRDEAALSAIVRLALERLRLDQEDGLPNVRGLLAFGLRKQLASARDAASRVSLELRLADLLEDSVDPRERGEALALYRDALAIDPESPTAVAGVLRVAAVQGDVAAQLAGEIAAAGIALDRATKVSHLLRATELARRVPPPEGGDAVAADLALRALREDADSAEAAAALSGLLLGRREARRLVDAFTEAVSAAKRPDRIVALAREAAHHAATSLDDVPVAIALLSQARGASPTDALLLVELGELYVRQRAWADAARAYDDAVAQSKSAAPSILVRAHRALAALHEGPLEDPQRALAELRAVCALAPDDVDAQRRVATALAARGDVDGALAALASMVEAKALPTRERVLALAQIADLRQTKGDLRGAEDALRHAIRLEPDPEGEAFARFTAFHARHGGDAALSAALGELLADPAADPRWIRFLGDLEVHRLGRPAEGLAHLRRALQVAQEGRLDLASTQLSYGEALLAMGAQDDAARALRDLLTREPTHAGALDAAHRAHAALGRRDEAQVVDEVRAYFGYHGSAATYRARRLPATPPRDEALEDVAIHAHLMPPAAKTAAYEIVHALADQLAKVYPPDLAGLGLSSRDRLTSRSGHPLRAMVDRAAHALGVSEIDLYVHESPEQRIVVENTEPPAVVVPATLQSLPELEIAFAIGRLVAKVATRTWLLDKLPPFEIEDLVLAAVAPYGGPSPRVRHAEVDDLARRVQKAVSRKTRRQLEEIAPRLASPIDGARFARAVDQGTIRAAYLLTGDLTSAIDHLRRYDERVVTDLGPETAVGELLRFALGPDASTLRRRLGTTHGA